MFSQRKKNYNWIWVVIVALIVMIAIFIIVASISSSNNNQPVKVNADTSTNQSKAPAENNNQKEDTSQKSENEFFESYYLVKYDNNNIKIYFSDETGKLTELETTTIVYDTLSEEDQSKFQKGVKVKTRDDLNRIIMDYES